VPPLINEPAADYRLRLEQALLSASTDLGPLGADNSFGRGMINLPAAYARLTAQPYLSIYDPAAPENDDQLFVSITPGTVRDLDFVLKNNGGAACDINLISNTLPAPEMTLIATCQATLPPGAQCTLTVRFAPVAFTRSSGQLVISSNGNDPQLPLRTLAVTGIGNSLPPPAQLLTPVINATGLASSVTFSWIQGDDLDGDALTKTLFLGPNLNDRTIIVAAVGTSGILITATGFFFWPLSGRRRQLLAAGIVVMLGLMVACGGGGGGGTPVASPDSIVVTGLSPDTTYYWKLRTEDSRGGVSESEVRKFTTR
jgi:hypothetical protein